MSDDMVQEAEPFVWLPKGLAEGELPHVIQRTLVLAVAERNSPQRSEAVREGFMAYLGEYMDCVTGAANAQTAGKLARGLDGPMLGLATTRQLLEELEARFMGVDTDAQDRVVYLLNELPEEVLAYRTVDAG